MKIERLLARLAKPELEPYWRQSTLKQLAYELNREQGFVYLMWMEGTPYYKIGASANPAQRLTEIGGVILPFDIVLIHSISTNYMFKLEHDLHRTYANKLVRGEWYSLESEDLLIIESLREMNYQAPLIAQMALVTSSASDKPHLGPEVKRCDRG